MRSFNLGIFTGVSTYLLAHCNCYTTLDRGIYDKAPSSLRPFVGPFNFQKVENGGNVWKICLKYAARLTSYSGLVKDMRRYQYNFVSELLSGFWGEVTQRKRAKVKRHSLPTSRGRLF